MKIIKISSLFAFLLIFSSLLSAQETPQLWDIKRSIVSSGNSAIDTQQKDFVNNGSFWIDGDVLHRESTVCSDPEGILCQRVTLEDRILDINESRALLEGVGSGIVHELLILSTSPTIILMRVNINGSVVVNEYEPRISIK